MFRLDDQTGLYPAVSMTGQECALKCDHCQGRLLETMIPVATPEALEQTARDLAQRGRLGLLVSGGSDAQGRLPWDRYLGVLEKITPLLTVTVHAGYMDQKTARDLKQAGVVQALVDVIGDDETARRVYHLKRGAAPVWETMDALAAVGLEAAPHVVFGLNYGKISGEYQALQRLATYRPVRLVTVVLTPMSSTPMAVCSPPPVDEAINFLVAARQALPKSLHHLGCARPRGKYGHKLEKAAVRAGINALALPSDTARKQAESMGLEIGFYKTCCSLAGVKR